MGGKDRPPALASGNYVQWKSIIKRYIDTKPNNELIHYCLQNPPYKFKWTEKTVSVVEGSSETTTEGYMEYFKNVSQDIRDQLNTKVEAVQIILTGVDNDIYSIVDACPNACEMWKAIERLKQGESINVQDLETNLYWEFRKFTSRDVLTSITTRMASDHVSSDPGPQCSTTVLEQDSLSPGPQSPENVPQVAETVTTSNELELLYSPMFSELLNGNSPVVSKSSAVHAADNPDKRQQHNTTHNSPTTDVADPHPLNIHSTHQTPTQVPTVTAPENITQAETNTENAQFDDDEFINIFSTPVQERINLTFDNLKMFINGTVINQKTGQYKH
ncbi:hypothetical protein Tco_0743024 [Tanacetum coccineum]